MSDRPKATIVNEGDNLYGVEYRGVLHVTQESHTVCSNVVEAINNREHWEPTECQEIADSILVFTGEDI